MLLYVTVSDGKLNVKNEVYVSIYDSNSSSNKNNQGGYYPQSNNPGSPNLNLPSFLSIPGYNPRPIPQHPRPPSASLFPIGNQLPPPTNSQPNSNPKRVQTLTYPDRNESNTTELSNDLNPVYSESDQPSVNDNHISENPVSGFVNHTDSAVRPISNLTVTLVPIVSVLVVFLVAGVISVVFWKKMCPMKPKSKKSDMVSLYFF
jgi:hypothetical protein